ncbi:MAG: PAS domain-containing sensor histidine kinase, partial [Anaerolineae bacterium]|nr:PAS domain-containing sensor histidine kinase [Anaerolineae bacterium]
KLAEQAVRESEQQLRQITENIQQVFYVIDFKTRHLLYVSPAYTTIWGQSIHEVPKDIPVYTANVHPDDQDLVLAAIRDETENQEPFNQEFRIIQPSGEVRYIWARNFLLRDDKGEAYRIVGIAEDLTERKEAEQRTLDLVLERERVHILTDFIEMASHEFRTPLSIVNTKLYLLERTKDQDQWPPHINEIRQQLADILTLIESLVTMTRLNQDVQKQVPVNVNSLVDILCRGLHLEVDAKSITLNHVLMEDGPIVLCDPEELRDAFEHIMINAIRYTPENGTVSIQEYEQNDSVVIEFRDTGIGMTPEEQAHIFESFYRADRAHTTRGFGLGLPIAQKIIERHGGRIEVESERDHGSIFRVILPQAAVLNDVTGNRREV